MNKKPKMTKLQPDIKESLETKKKRDVLYKARAKLLNLSEALKHRTPDMHVTNDKKAMTKSMTQCTLDYFFKHSNKDNKNPVMANRQIKHALAKQLSLGSYPIEIKISSPEEDVDGIENELTRVRPATVCVDKPSEMRCTEALALERPRKKLSFKEPEVTNYKPKTATNGYSNEKSNGYSTISRKNEKNSLLSKNKCTYNYPQNKQNLEFNGILHKSPSSEYYDLESQAMRVVRTIGQAFEVCHKLSINAPEQDNLDQDEQDTLTQDLLSDRFSDITSDKPKKDLISEGASDKVSLPADDISLKDTFIENNNKNNRLLDILPPPPSNNKNNNNRKTPLSTAETYAAPHSDTLTGGGGGSVGSGSGSGSLPPAGSALSVHHELQLMREQLEQQSQQTQAAMAQLQLAREQLAAEQSARVEAQARTHQLLVHNRELLDHIAALVAHLQGGEKAGQQQTPPHMTLPQQTQFSNFGDSNYQPSLQNTSLDNSPLYQALGQSLIENRNVASALPTSPLTSNYHPSGNVFNFGFPPSLENTTATIEAQILQRLRNITGMPSTANYPFNYNQSLPYLSQDLYNQPYLNNNSYNLQPPPQKKFSAAQFSTLPRYSGNPGLETTNQSRKSEPRQIPSSTSYQSLLGLQNQFTNQGYQNQNQFANQHQPQNQNLESRLQQSQSQMNFNQFQNEQSGSQRLQVDNCDRQQREVSPNPQNLNNDNRDAQFIKPLSQLGTLTTTDAEGRYKVIVPVPSESNESVTSLLSNLRVNDNLRPSNGPGMVTRSASERVPNRSELMSQVQRTAWARHTTK